jgi:tetratricopeptide (TPR) repeat protein
MRSRKVSGILSSVREKTKALGRNKLADDNGDDAGYRIPHTYGWEKDSRGDFYELGEDEGYYDVNSEDNYDDYGGDQDRLPPGEVDPYDDLDRGAFVGADDGPFYVPRPKKRITSDIAAEPMPINTEYTPEWYDKGDRKKRKPIAEKKSLSTTEKRKRKILLIGGGSLALALIVVGIVYFGFIHPKDNYDAQMKIGLEHYSKGEWEKAEEAFNRALEYKKGDTNAIIGLSDTYVGWKKYDNAIKKLTSLQKTDEQDVRTYDRLINIYVKNKKDMAKANEQIVKCFTLGLALDNKNVAAVATFTPAAGNYAEAISVTAEGPEGYTLFYTTDGQIPNGADVGAPFTEPLAIKKKDPITVTVVGYNAEGLMSWPGTAHYVVDINYAIDTTGPNCVGKSASSVISDMGALYYSGTREDGYYYRSEDSTYMFAFPKDAFGVDKDGKPNDPEKTALPPAAICSAVQQSADTLCMQVGEQIPIEDLMIGLGVDTYNVNDDNTLTYWYGGKYYKYMLQNMTTIYGGDIVRVTAG